VTATLATWRRDVGDSGNGARREARLKGIASLHPSCGLHSHKYL
jgi:hypothetical protein